MRFTEIALIAPTSLLFFSTYRLSLFSSTYLFLLLFSIKSLFNDLEVIIAICAFKKYNAGEVEVMMEYICACLCVCVCVNREQNQSYSGF